MKLSEFENEKALDLLADILEPTAEIFTDKELVDYARNGKKIKAINVALKNHQESVIAILAALDGVEPKDYKGNIVTMTVSLLEILNDDDLISVFRSQGQMISSVASGSATENTEENEK